MAFAGRCADMLMRYRLQMLPAQMKLLDSHYRPPLPLALRGRPGGRYRLAVLFEMAFVGMPTVFYGDELGIEGISELDYRAPMPWGGGDGKLQGFFRRAITLRHERTSSAAAISVL